MTYDIQILGPNQASRSQSLGVGIIVVREKLIITDGRAPHYPARYTTRVNPPQHLPLLRVRERILSPIKRWTQNSH